MGKKSGRLSQAIGRRGELIAAESLEKIGFIVRKEDIDLGEDFSIEEDNQTTAIIERYLIQVKAKSQRTSRLRNDSWRVPLDTHNLKRWMLQCLPVFIIAVDNDNRKCRWIDVQGELRKFGGKLPKSLLAISENEINENNYEIFRNALAKAQHEKRASLVTPAVALEHRSRQLQILDERFAVTGNCIRGHEIYEIRAVAPVKISVSLQGTKESAEEIAEAIRYGSSFTINMDETIISGSKLMSHIASTSRTAQFSPEPQNKCIQVTWDENGKKFKTIDPYAKVTKGLAGSTLAIAPPGCPLSFIAVIDRDSPKNSRAKLNISYYNWLGKPLRQLPFYREISALLKSNASRTNFTFHTLTPTRQRIANFSISQSYHSLNIYRDHLERLEPLIKVAKRSGSRAVLLDKDITAEDIFMWKCGERLTAGRNVELHLNDFAVDILERENLDKIFEEIISANCEIALTLDLEIRAWGQLVSTIPVIVGIVNFKPVKSPKNGVITMMRQENSSSIAYLNENNDVQAKSICLSAKITTS